MNLLIALLLLDLALGSLAVFAVYRHLPGGFGRALSSSVVLAIFFSLALVGDRIVVFPLPPFVVVVGAVVDGYQAMNTPCAMHSTEGCLPPIVGEPSVSLGPVLSQFAIWLEMASALEKALRNRRRSESRQDHA